MEQLLSSLVFNGSIIEAITEAKQQKKLFVVFVSGGNMKSNQLETSTWLDSRVADSISKWEALRLPKVKVAAVQGSKLNKEQTSYMPQIPDIASCLEHLLPLKEWEEAILADFSELRLALSRMEANVGTSPQLPSATLVDQQRSSDQLPENIVLDKFDGLMSEEDESSLSDDPALGNSIPKSSPFNSPTLSVILRMDAVARVSMLRKRITAVQSMNALSRNDCLWLFALCAAVDTPVDADTCAALWSLLRKCASLRADKSKLDDEVIMLHMLVTICGRYFGQSESFLLRQRALLVVT